MITFMFCVFSHKLKNFEYNAQYIRSKWTPKQCVHHQLCRDLGENPLSASNSRQSPPL